MSDFQNDKTGKRKLTFGEILISNEEIGSDLPLPVLYDLLIDWLSDEVDRSMYG